MVVPFEDLLTVVFTSIVQHRASMPDTKIIAFFTTARLTQYAAELMNAAGVPTLEIHSRKSQPQRDKASAAFRAATEAVLFSSDVSARGVDYPDVTFVLQVTLCDVMTLVALCRVSCVTRVGRLPQAARACRVARGPGSRV